MSQVAVVDYGMGNLRSVAKALEAVSDRHTRVEVTQSPSKILAASHVVFPGQGAMGACRSALDELGLTDIIVKVATDKPFLGICIGMQLLLAHSDENGGVAGLNMIAGNSHRFIATQDREIKVPHMGWNQVHQTTHHPLWQQISQDSYFYFVHSYFAKPDHNQTVAATTYYANQFTSAIYQDNIFAVQFHPEKSQRAGLILLSNFLNWHGAS